VPGSCIVVPDHLQTYFRILQQNRVAFIYLFHTLSVEACHQKHQNRENLLGVILMYIYLSWIDYRDPSTGSNYLNCYAVRLLCDLVYSCVTFIVTLLTRCSVPFLVQNCSTSTLLLWTHKFEVSCYLYISYNHCVPNSCEWVIRTA